MEVKIWSVNYLIDVAEIFGSPSIFKTDILGDLHAKFQDFCSKCTIVLLYHYTIEGGARNTQFYFISKLDMVTFLQN